MERLTTNKSVADMSMIELAHNSCYADDERNARYRDYDMEMDARDFTRNLMATLTKDELPVDDAEFDEEVLDNLTIDPFSDVRGLIALFYRNMWSMADLREKLKRYEDAEEQGLLLRLPCKVGDIVYKVNKASKKISKHRVLKIEIEKMEGTDFTTQIWFENYDFTFAHRFGEVIFFTRDEAEAKLKEMEGESDVL